MAISTDKLQTLKQSKEQLERVKEELDKKANSDDVYSKQDVDDKIGAVQKSVSTAYVAAGSITFSELPEADEEHAGYVYNITDEFTTTENFLEGSGKTFPAGTDVAIVVEDGGSSYKYNVFGSFVDTSKFVEKDGNKVLSDQNYTDADKSKLDGIYEGATKVEVSETLGNIRINDEEATLFNVASDEENSQMLDTVFGTDEG